MVVYMTNFWSFKWQIKKTKEICVCVCECKTQWWFISFTNKVVWHICIVFLYTRFPTWCNPSGHNYHLHNYWCCSNRNHSPKRLHNLSMDSYIKEGNQFSKCSDAVAFLSFNDDLFQQQNCVCVSASERDSRSRRKSKNCCCKWE